MAGIRQWSRFGVIAELLRRDLRVTELELMVALVAIADEDAAFEVALADLVGATGRGTSTITRALGSLLGRDLIYRTPGNTTVAGFVNVARIGGRAVEVGQLADGSVIRSSGPAPGHSRGRRSGHRTATRSAHTHTALSGSEEEERTKKRGAARRAQKTLSPDELTTEERARLRSLLEAEGRTHTDVELRHGERIVLASARSNGRASADWTSAVFGGIMRGWALEGATAETTRRGRMASQGERRGRRSGPDIMRAEPKGGDGGGKRTDDEW